MIYLDFNGCKLKLCEEHFQELQTDNNKKLFDKYLNKSHVLYPDKKNVDLLRKLEADYMGTTNRWLEKVEQNISSVEQKRAEFITLRKKAEIALIFTIEEIIKDLKKLLAAPDILISQALCPNFADYPKQLESDLKQLFAYRDAGKKARMNIKGLAEIYESMEKQQGDWEMKESDLQQKESEIQRCHSMFESRLENCPLLAETKPDQQDKGVGQFKSSDFWEDKIIEYIFNYSANIKYEKEPLFPNTAIVVNSDKGATDAENRPGMQFLRVKNLVVDRSKWQFLRKLNDSEKVTPRLQRFANKLVELRAQAKSTEWVIKPTYSELITAILTDKSLMSLVDEKNTSFSNIERISQNFVFMNANFEILFNKDIKLKHQSKHEQSDAFIQFKRPKEGYSSRGSKKHGPTSKLMTINQPRAR